MGNGLPELNIWGTASPVVWKHTQEIRQWRNWWKILIEQEQFGAVPHLSFPTNSLSCCSGASPGALWAFGQGGYAKRELCDMNLLLFPASPGSLPSNIFLLQDTSTTAA